MNELHHTINANELFFVFLFLALRNGPASFNYVAILSTRTRERERERSHDQYLALTELTIKHTSCGEVIVSIFVSSPFRLPLFFIFVIIVIILLFLFPFGVVKRCNTLVCRKPPVLSYKAG